MDFKDIIANEIANILNIDKIEIFKNIEVPKEEKNGDLTFPCFSLSKILKKSPQIIAEEIKEKIDLDKNQIIEKIENINGFLNFYILKEKIVEETIEKFNKKKEMYGSSEIGKNKKIIVEYSSPNIAKPFHIGHLKNTIIGHGLYNIYKFLGYDTISLNHIGDYGTQFAKLIVGYKMWGNEYDFTNSPIDKLTDIYKRINILCKEDEKILEECRETFIKLEQGDEFCKTLWNKFKDLSMEEFNRIYKKLGVEFDEIDGESFYADKMDEIVELLEKSGKLEESQGAKIIDLEDKGINTPCIVKKSNGASIYATRDLATILYRSRTYDFDECLYIVGVEQSLYFKQIFAVAEYLGIDKKYLDGLKHISYGMIRLPEGKMSTRAGNFVKAEDLLKEVNEKAEEIIKDREIENKDKIIEQVALAAVIIDNIKEGRIKEQVFDVKTALNFNGETGPYIQYMIVRTKSILNKIEEIIEMKKEDYKLLTDEYSIDLLKRISRFEEILEMSLNKSELSILVRYTIELAQSFSRFYNNNKVITEDIRLQNARIYLTYMTNIVLSNSLKLLGIEIPKKM